MMQLISLQGWDRLLYIIVEENGQPWMAESNLPKARFPQLHGYASHKEMLLAWKAPIGIKQ